MPVYEVPATENDAGATVPEDNDAVHDEVDPAEVRYHYRQGTVYVASNVEIPTYAERVDDDEDSVRSLGAQEMHEFPAPETDSSSDGSDSDEED